MKNKSVKISLNDYLLLEEIRLFVCKKKRFSISKKDMLGWLIKKASQEIKNK